VHKNPNFGKEEVASDNTTRKSDAGFLYCRLSIVTSALSRTIQLQFAIECFRCTNQQGCVNLGQHLAGNGSNDVNQILTRSGRHIWGCRVHKKSCRYFLLFKKKARTWQTCRQKNRPRNG